MHESMEHQNLEDHRAAEGWKRSPNAANQLMESWDPEDMGNTDCPDGCVVEDDGHCPHGYESAGLTAGLI